MIREPSGGVAVYPGVRDLADAVRHGGLLPDRARWLTQPGGECEQHRACRGEVTGRDAAVAAHTVAAKCRRLGFHHEKRRSRLRRFLNFIVGRRYCRPSLIALASEPSASSPLNSQKKAPPRFWALTYCIFSKISAGSS